MDAGELQGLMLSKYNEEVLTQNLLTRDILFSATEQVLKEYGAVLKPAALMNHVGNYVLLGEFCGQWLTLPRPQIDPQSNRQLEVVDIGAGFGSFALGAAREGPRVIGVERSHDLVEIAKKRAATFANAFRTAPRFLVGDARDLPLEDASTDLVTAWNVLEHIDDLSRVVTEVSRVLRPGGWFTLVAPNYLAVRKEAHYLVPWLPLLPKPIGAQYLRILGRDPEFLLADVWYRTRPEVRTQLRKRFSLVLTAQEIRSRGLRLISRPGWQRPRWRPAAATVDTLLRIEALNPFGHSIVLCAQKCTP